MSLKQREWVDKRRTVHRIVGDAVFPNVWPTMRVSLTRLKSASNR